MPKKQIRYTVMPDKIFETVVCINHYDNVMPLYANQMNKHKHKKKNVRSKYFSKHRLQRCNALCRV